MPTSRCRGTARPSAASRCAALRWPRPISRKTTTRIDDQGFFDTGDVGTMDRYGYMQITDRSKDVIKSGGEWISSIDLENLAVGHPKVAEAAVIGVRHPKWDERPLLVIVLKEGQSATKDEILALPQRQDREAGGCPTMSCSSAPYRTRRPARSRRPCCAISSRITCCRPRSQPNKFPRFARVRGARRPLRPPRLTL